MIDIGPNLTQVLLALAAILAILAQGYAGQKHAETTQRLTNGIAAETIAAHTRAMAAAVLVWSREEHQGPSFGADRREHPFMADLWSETPGHRGGIWRFNGPGRPDLGRLFLLVGWRTR